MTRPALPPAPGFGILVGASLVSVFLIGLLLMTEPAQAAAISLPFSH